MKFSIIVVKVLELLFSYGPTSKVKNVEKGGHLSNDRRLISIKYFKIHENYISKYIDKKPGEKSDFAFISCLLENKNENITHIEWRQS